MLSVGIFANNGFQDYVPFRKYTRNARLAGSASFLLIFVTRFTKTILNRFCSLTRYDRFDNPPCVTRRGLRSGSPIGESASWFIGKADIPLRVTIVYYITGNGTCQAPFPAFSYRST